MAAFNRSLFATVVATLMMVMLFSSMTTVDALSVGDCPDICKCFKKNKPNINALDNGLGILNGCKEVNKNFYADDVSVDTNSGDASCPYIYKADVTQKNGGDECKYKVCVTADANGNVDKFGSSTNVTVENTQGVEYASGTKDCNGSLARSVVVSVAAIILSVLFVSL